MSNTYKFVWTDELALEFLNFRIKYAAGFPHETVLKHFKQSKEQVEEKRIEVKKFCLQSSSDKESWYEFLIKGYITEDKYEAVKQAIENVLTDIPQYYCGIRPEQLTIETIKRDYKPPVVVVNGERYIEEQKDAIPPTPEPQDSKEEPKPLLITDDNVKLFKEEDLYWRVYDDFSYGQFMVKDKASYSTEATFISEELASAYVQLRKNKVNIRIS